MKDDSLDGLELGEEAGRPSRALDLRRFSDEEVAELLRRAVQLQESAPELAPGGPRTGLSLAEIRQVAAEAGIDPRYVEIAAGALETADEHDTNLFAGAPTSWHLTRVVEGEVPDEARARVVSAIRSVMAQKGGVTDVYGRMEWTYNDGFGPVNVGMVSQDGRTEIDVSSSRGGQVGLIFGLGLPLTALLGGVIGTEALGLTDLAALSTVAAAGLAYLGAGRLLWKRLSRRWARRLDRLADSVAAAASRAALQPGGDR